MTHGSTFGGNPLACAAALAAIEVMTSQHALNVPGTSRNAWHAGETLPDRAERLGVQLRARLRGIDSPLIREVRGLGLLIGVDLKVKVTPILQKLQALGVLALPAGATVLRLLPPLVIEEEDLERVAAAIEAALGQAGG